MYRTGLITFCGSGINIDYDPNGVDGKTCLMKFENGDYTQKRIVTCHPNIVRGLVTAKKGWGLWVKEWSDGISDGLLSKEEILEEFEKKNIVLPDSYLLELDNAIRKKKYK